MTVKTPELETQKHAFFCSSGQFAGVPKARREWFTKSDGTNVLSVTGEPIFRSGTFRDSFGDQHTYFPEHMQMMVGNFGILKSARIFEEPPVRKGHPNFFTNYMDELIGHAVDLRAEVHISPVTGESYTYLMADYEILDSAAADKINSGLWKNRSAEIGAYVSNDEAELWPVLMGFAYVDIPAVEGLNFSKDSGVGKDFAVIIDKEDPLVEDENNTGETGAQQTGGTAGTVFQAPAPLPPLGNQAAQTANTLQLNPFMFTMSGAQTSDYAAVQKRLGEQETELAELREFAKQTKESGRKAFVDNLIATNRVFASQKDELNKFTSSLSDDQWAMFTASYEAAPEVPALGQHGVNDQVTPPPSDEEVETDRHQRIYSRHKASGMPADEVEATPSAKHLKAKGLI